jgi:hypothetical protein
MLTVVVMIVVMAMAWRHHRHGLLDRANLTKR